MGYGIQYFAEDAGEQQRVFYRNESGRKVTLGFTPVGSAHQQEEWAKARVLKHADRYNTGVSLCIFGRNLHLR